MKSRSRSISNLKYKYDHVGTFNIFGLRKDLRKYTNIKNSN